jgi:hypothetical protein
VSSPLSHEQSEPRSTDPELISTSSEEFHFVDQVSKIKNGETCPLPKIISSSEFDMGFQYVPKEVRMRGREIAAGMTELGFDLLELRKSAAKATENEAQSVAEKIHAAAAILYTQWENARNEKKR